MKRLGSVSRRLGGVLEASWRRPGRRLGALAGVLAHSWADLGAILAPKWREVGINIESKMALHKNDVQAEKHKKNIITLTI